VPAGVAVVVVQLTFLMPVGTTDGPEREQLTPVAGEVGARVKVTVWAVPLKSVAVIVFEPGFPAVTVMLPELVRE